MATKNFRSTVLEPTSEFAHGDKLRFTALATVGEVLKGSFSETTIGEDGVYSVDLQYGKHRIDYKPYEGVWRHFADIEVNADTLSTTLQDLALASAPVTDETILVLQGILADAEAAKTAAETAIAGIDDKIADTEAGYPSLLAAQLSKAVTVNVITGDDSTADGSSEKPYKTIKSAIESQPDRIILTVNLVGSSQSSTHLIDSEILLLSRIVTISCSEQYIKISAIAGAYAFDVRDRGKLTIKASVRCHFYIESAESSTVLVGASGNAGCYLQNVNFYLSSGAKFYFIGYRTIKEHGISTLSTSFVNFVDYTDKTSPTAGQVTDCDSTLSGATFVQHHAGSFGSNYQNTMTESVIAGTLKAVSK